MEGTSGKLAHDGEAVRRLLSDLDLSEHAVELDILGYTIVPPDKAAPAGLIERVRTQLLDLVERRDGIRADTASGETHRNRRFPNYYYLLFEDEVFEELLMMPAALALVTRLLGWSCVLSTSTALIKGPTSRGIGLDIDLHCDTEMHPPPFPLFAQYANVTWLLSDYSKEGGSLCFVPGSHLLCRQPEPQEGYDQLVPVEAPMGSSSCGTATHGTGRFAGRLRACASPSRSCSRGGTCCRGAIPRGRAEGDARSTPASIRDAHGTARDGRLAI